MKRILLCGVILLAGCQATFDSAINDINNIFAGTGEMAGTSIEINNTASEICTRIKSNPVAAANSFKGKILAQDGVIRSIREDGSPKYRVVVKSGDLSIHATTNDDSKINSLSTKQKVKVHGEVVAVSKAVGCSITLMNSRFY